MSSKKKEDAVEVNFEVETGPSLKERVAAIGKRAVDVGGDLAKITLGAVVAVVVVDGVRGLKEKRRESKALSSASSADNTDI